MTAPTPPPETLDAIARKAVQIQQHARYLGNCTRSADEDHAVAATRRLAREIETLIETIEEGKAA